MGTIWGRSGTLEWDNNGILAEGALAYFYEAGTSTPKAVYSDGDESTAHEHPVEADDGRWPAVFIPFGSYKLVIKTAGGTTIFTADNIPNPEPFDETFEVDEDAQYQTGDFIFVGKNGTRAGAVRCNARTIGDASSGATERANADCADLFAYIWNNYGSTLRAFVSGGAGATAAADFAAHKTIPMPNYRGVTIVGFDDMGNTAEGAFASCPAFFGSATLAGSVMGENTHALITAELSAHTHGVSITSDGGSAHSHALTAASAAAGGDHSHTGSTGTDSPDHSHNVTTNTNTANAPGNATFLSNGSGNTFASAGRSTTHTHSISASGTHTHTLSGSTDAESAHTHLVSGTSASAGSGTAHNIMALSAPVTILMKL